VSSEIGDCLVRQFAADARRIHVISCGVDVERFAPITDRASVRLQLGFAPADSVIVWVGSGPAAQRKGLDTVLACARSLPHVTFALVGIRTVDAAPANCRFAGSVPNGDIPRWLQAADRESACASSARGDGMRCSWDRRPCGRSPGRDPTRTKRIPCFVRRREVLCRHSCLLPGVDQRASRSNGGRGPRDNPAQLRRRCSRATHCRCV
jgi:hypothetical protein